MRPCRMTASLVALPRPAPGYSCYSAMRNRQPHLKVRLAGTRIDTHIAMMLPDNPVNRVEAEAGAFTYRLGSKEWIEDSALDLGRNARSVVDDLDQRGGAIPRRANGYLALPRLGLFGQSVDCVVNQV